MMAGDGREPFLFLPRRRLLGRDMANWFPMTGVLLQKCAHGPGGSSFSIVTFREDGFRVRRRTVR